MKVSELIQALLDIQHQAGEDLDIKSVLYDEYEDKFTETGILSPILMHQPDSMDQTCILGMTDNLRLEPEKYNHYLIRYLDDTWQYGACDVKWLSWSERDALKNAG